MGSPTKQGFLRKWIFYIVGCSRFTILIFICIFYSQGRLTPHEFNETTALVLPISVLYLIFIGKYIIERSRYFYPGAGITRSDLIWGCAPLVILHVSEILLILFRDLINIQNNDSIFWWIAIIESMVAAYAGFYLSRLFVDSSNVSQSAAE
jgi:hypothetical protein